MHATKPPVFVLITWDIDPSPKASLESKQLSLEVATELCNEFNVRSTFFTTANAGQASPSALQRIQSFGNEIGCHGLTHGNEEDYNRMPETMQRDYIIKATEKLENMANAPIRAFRSPRVKTSASTLRLLAECGYLADSSVCSQRIDFISSNLINMGWVLAPRRPYHPHYENAFRKGNLPIWEVPVSAAIIPFISAVLSILGPSFMKAFFRLLYSEAKLTGKPIVYLGHPAEFTTGHQRRYSLKEFSPTYIRTHGLLLRTSLYREKEAWLEATRQLFGYMASFPDVQFMTVTEYVTKVLNKRA
ncbi:MAG: polysaccharide deacetylase family protein [Anaerolineales bacterium]|nr:polysaccharide deacetylase family protein [Anaerolineales bacterium]